MALHLKQRLSVCFSVRIGHAHGLRLARVGETAVLAQIAVYAIG